MARATILCVVGTRPEAVKLAPLILALGAHPRLQPLVVATGQHGELLDGALGEFGLVADINLALMRRGQSPVEVVAAALLALSIEIVRHRPAAVVAQGDTATAAAAAQAAIYARVPLVHVEAGLRSGGTDEPFPEEFHRRMIGQLASLHFAPTATARAALLAENVDPATIHVTGNSGIDALRLIEARLTGGDVRAALPRFDRSRPLLVVTVHRRENHGGPLLHIAAALRQLAEGGTEVVVPVHPHPDVAGPLHAALDGVPHIHLIPPLGYAAFIGLLRQAALVLTDSGGVQEEAPALGVPVLVLRRRTEREEGIASGNARLIGTGTRAIVEAVRGLLDTPALARMSEAALPYGDGLATPRMVAVLDRLYGGAEALHQRHEAWKTGGDRRGVVDHDRRSSM